MLGKAELEEGRVQRFTEDAIDGEPSKQFPLNPTQIKFSIHFL